MFYSCCWCDNYIGPSYTNLCVKLKSNHIGKKDLAHVTFRQVLTCSLTFTRGWATRPHFISLTSTGTVSIAENVAPVAGVVGC